MPDYDYLIVGAGLYGAVFAREMVNAGKKVLIIEKRDHIAGNCYTRNDEGINVHQYGAHIMHTNDHKVWSYIQNYCQLNNYTNRVKANYQGTIYSLPINMNTLHQVYGVITPEQAEKKIESLKVPIDNPKNLQEWMHASVGEELYEMFIKGYTTKQWGKSPTELPASIIKRLPIRLTYNDNYFNDRYQGIPIGGYTQFFEHLLDRIPVQLSTDFLADREYWLNQAKEIVYCGMIDEFLNYQDGELEWRSLRFDHNRLEERNYQGTAVMNYTELDIPFTRVLEHKHFEHTGTLPNLGHTVVTHEYPQEWDRSKEAYYPVRDVNGESALYDKYHSFALKEFPKVHFKGRMAEYIYRDMCPTIRSALDFVSEKLN